MGEKVNFFKCRICGNVIELLEGDLSPVTKFTDGKSSVGGCFTEGKSSEKEEYL